MIPQKIELQQTFERIRSYVHRTPVMTSSLLNEFTGAKLFFKCENFQRMGAFKMRGATNAILCLSDENRNQGVVTHSSGNFAQALSLTARIFGIPAFIVMPSNAPEIKKEAVKNYGGEIIECKPTLQAREKTVKQVIKTSGATFIHPYNDMNVILGQGTVAMELLEEQPSLDFLVVPVGGGGLIAGTAVATHYFSQNAEVIGAEPFGADDAWHSLFEGKIVPSINPKTIADGLRTSLGDKNFPIIQQLVEEIIRVEEDEIVFAMRLIWERMKIIVEPSGAVAPAAVLREKNKFKGKNVGIIISGGNVDLGNLPF